MPDKRKYSSVKWQYWISIFSVVTVSVSCFPIAEWIGYRSVALILLLVLSVLAMRLSLYPVLLGAVLSALIWDFFFIPPHFTFTVGNTEDALLLIMYFFIAMLNGVLTNQIKTYEKLTRQKEEKEKALRLYNTWFNSISHELRTPIAAIWAASENLLETGHHWSEEDRQKLTREIHIAAKRLNRLVDNLLNTSRLETGFFQPKKDWCDLNELVFGAIHQLEDELQGRKVEVDIPENSPLVRLDFGLIEQVMFNILYNAAIYTPASATIRISAHFSDNQCCLVIEDEGPGFPDDDLKRVFEKFYRAKGTQAGGTGLGLSIAKGLVDAHQGKIKVENKTGGGAKFTIVIPSEMTYINAYPNE